MKMKAYATFADYLAEQPPKHQSIIRALRRFVKRSAPQLQEAVQWGDGCWVTENAPVAYGYSARDHVQFGFCRGGQLKDPKPLLQGQGRFVRHIKLTRPTDLDEDTFQALLRQAAR